MNQENNDIIKSLRYSFRNLHDLVALIILIVLAIGIFYWPIYPVMKEVIPAGICFIILALILIFIIIYWLIYKFRLPRNKHNKIGVILSIYSEENEELLKLKQDLIDKVRSNIVDCQLSDVISVLEIKNHISKNIKTSNDLRKIHQKIHGHFYIRGTLKKRIEGDPKN